MPVDLLKLDRVFVARLGYEEERGLAAGIVELARSLGIDTVAEGVEQADQARKLRTWAARLRKVTSLPGPSKRTRSPS